MRLMKSLIVAVAAATMLAPSARADVKMPALFSDGMVLQRGMPCPIWGTAQPGEKVSVSLMSGDKTLYTTEPYVVGKDGKWLLALPSESAGGPYSLRIDANNKIAIKDVYVGEVWVCSGQSNMQWELKDSFEAKKDIDNSHNPKIRLFSVPRIPQDKETTALNAKWVECDPKTVGGFSAVGYYFGRDLQKALNVPVGLIHSSWGGTIAEAWATPESLQANERLNKELVQPYKANRAKALDTYPKSLEKYKADLEKYKLAAEEAKKEGKPAPMAPKAPNDPNKDGNPNRPSVLYNGMIYPLQPYAIRGAIWYQGESNADRAEQYKTLFPTMITSWRQSWSNPDLVFLCVQLAPWQKIEDKPTDTGWARLREAQLSTALNLPKTGMVVITDVGDEKDIHPRKKEPVGARLALQARALAYGEQIEFSGPIYSNVIFDGDQAILSFNHVGKGLEAKGEDGKLVGFTIAGEDGVFRKASATIKGDKVVVTSPEVAKPVAVRYGWANYPVVNLWNKDGLPASPFRTDDWALNAGPKPTTIAK